MKRIVSLAAIVLTLTMALSLAACGEEPGTNENTENGQNQTSSNETGKTVDLAALRTQFVTDYSLTDVLEVETEGLNNLYGITEDMVKNSASFSASSGGSSKRSRGRFSLIIFFISSSMAGRSSVERGCSRSKS